MIDTFSEVHIIIMWICVDVAQQTTHPTHATRQHHAVWGHPRERSGLLQDGSVVWLLEGRNYFKEKSMFMDAKLNGLTFCCKVDNFEYLSINPAHYTELMQPCISDSHCVQKQLFPASEEFCFSNRYSCLGDRATCHGGASGRQAWFCWGLQVRNHRKHDYLILIFISLLFFFKSK